VQKGDHFCILPWIGIHLETNGEIKPCCFVSDKFESVKLGNSSFSQLQKSRPFENLRKIFLKGQSPPACQGCFNLEKLGGESLRTHSNREYTFDRQLKVKKLDLRFSNICNFRCRTCNQNESTSWYNEYNTLHSNKLTKPLLPFNDEDKFWKHIETVIPDLESVYILGGEPLLDPRHYKFLDLLLKYSKNNIKILYSTNLSTLTLGEKSVLKYWKKFTNINLLLSYDAHGELGELIRKGMFWDQTQRNHRLIQKEKNINYMITPTISNLNIFSITEFITHLVDKMMITDGSQIGFNFLRNPLSYNIQTLPFEQKSIIQKHIQSFISNEINSYKITNLNNLKDQFHLLLNYLNIEIKDTRQHHLTFVANSLYLNKIRNEKILHLVPDLRALFKKYLTTL